MGKCTPQQALASAERAAGVHLLDEVRKLKAEIETLKKKLADKQPTYTDRIRALETEHAAARKREDGHKEEIIRLARESGEKTEALVNARKGILLAAMYDSCVLSDEDQEFYDREYSLAQPDHLPDAAKKVGDEQQGSSVASAQNALDDIANKVRRDEMRPTVSSKRKGF